MTTIKKSLALKASDLLALHSLNCNAKFEENCESGFNMVRLQDAQQSLRKKALEMGLLAEELEFVTTFAWQNFDWLHGVWHKFRSRELNNEIVTVKLP